MSAAQVRYRNLAARRPSFAPDHADPIQEAAMIKDNQSVGLRVAALADDPTCGRRPRGEIAGAVSRALFVGATAALFVAWLALAH